MYLKKEDKNAVKVDNDWGRVKRRVDVAGHVSRHTKHNKIRELDESEVSGDISMQMR